MALTGLSTLVRKVVLLYFKEMFESDPNAKEALIAKSSLERNILIWICERGFNVTSLQGSHDEEELDSLARASFQV
jgi:hypothetical protein